MACLLAVTLCAGCATDAADPSADPAVCDGKCDDGEVSSPLISCFIDPSTEPDPFFRVDALNCQFTPSGAAGIPIARAYVEVHTANGKVSSDSRADAGGFTLAGLDQDAYPAQLIVTYSFGSVATPGLTSLGNRSVKETYTIASAASATAEQPLDVELPFALWHVKVTNRSSTTTGLRLHHDVTPELAIDEYVAASYGARADLYVAVPRGAVAVPVKVTGASTTDAQLDGSGDYEITAAGALVHAGAPAQPAGAIAALCWRGVTQVGATTRTDIQCSPVADRAAVTVTVDVAPSTGTPVTLDLADTQEVSFDGRVDARITVHATVTDALEDLSALTARTFTRSGTLTDATDTQLLARLPFTIARTEWIATADAYGFFQLPARELDLGDHAQAVVSIPARNVDVSPSSDVVEYFVLAPGVALAGDGLVAPVSSGPTVENLPVTIDGDAIYDVTTTGIARR